MAIVATFLGADLGRPLVAGSTDIPLFEFPAEAVRSLKAGREPDLLSPLSVTTEINLHVLRDGGAAVGVARGLHQKIPTPMSRSNASPTSPSRPRASATRRSPASTRPTCWKPSSSGRTW